MLNVIMTTYNIPCHYALCRHAVNITLSVVKPCVITMLSSLMPCVIMLSVILSVVMLTVIMLSA